MYGWRWLALLVLPAATFAAETTASVFPATYRTPSQLAALVTPPRDETEAMPVWPAGLQDLRADDAHGVVVATGTPEAVAEMSALLRLMDVEPVPLTCTVRRFRAAELVVTRELAGADLPVRALPSDSVPHSELAVTTSAPIAKLIRALGLADKPVDFVWRSATAGQPTVLPLTELTRKGDTTEVRTTWLMVLARMTGSKGHEMVSVTVQLDPYRTTLFQADGSETHTSAPRLHLGGIMVREPQGQAILVCRRGPVVAAAVAWPMFPIGGEEQEWLLLDVEPVAESGAATTPVPAAVWPLRPVPLRN